MLGWFFGLLSMSVLGFLRTGVPILLLLQGLALQSCAWAQAGAGQDCAALVSPEHVLETLNRLRAQARSCGSGLLPAGPPLQWDARLAASARSHAADLSQGEQLSHMGPRGAGLRERMRQSGYPAQRAGENLAAGQESLDEVLHTWATSAKHCDNLMQAEYSEVGMACVAGPGRFQRYWVMNLGRISQEPWVPAR